MTDDEVNVKVNPTENEHKLGTIIDSNRHIRSCVRRSVNEFLSVRENLLEQLSTKHLDDVRNVLAPLVDAIRIETLNRQVTSNNIQLALCGENSSGKTTFVHMLLQIGDILPADVGPITARVLKLTYAPAEQACAYVYPSLEASLMESAEQNAVCQINLIPFFELDDDEPDWDAIADKLSPHVKRPDGMNIHSSEFAKWAKQFVEVRLPSPTLELGIDVYDTAGFRHRDAQILKDVLYDLVRLVHPTLIFLYDNPSSTDETNDCFLALKHTLKSLDSSNIFFLNTKADIDKMPGINKITTEEEFRTFLAEERAKRYELLLSTPGMANAMPGGLPKSVDKCNCFDLCSANSFTMQWGRIMNEIATSRLIQFVSNRDLAMAQRVSNLVLPAIESFFDLTLVTSHRKQNQLLQLRLDAVKWQETYFQEHHNGFNNFLQEVFDSISNRLSITKDDLARRAAQQKHPDSIQTFIHLAVKHEVLKKVVHDALGFMLMTVLNLMFSRHDLMVNAASNELLVAAVRSKDSDLIAIAAEESTSAGALRYFMINTLMAPALMVTEQLFNEEQDENTAETVTTLLSCLQAIRSQTVWGHTSGDILDVDPLFEAYQCLACVQQQLDDQKMLLDIIVSTWRSQQKSKLQAKIDEQYRAANVLLPVRRQAHDLLQQYAPQFALIECQLQAAQDLAKFDGKKPSILDDGQLPITVYSIQKAEWGSTTKSLFVKRLTHPETGRPYAAYLEAHYHRKVTSLNISRIIPLVYLYENKLPDGSYELWMIFSAPKPGIKSNLSTFLQRQTSVTFKKVLEILIPMAGALAGLHENELVHRNLQASNILLDEDDDSFLADLGDWYIKNNDSFSVELNSGWNVTDHLGENISSIVEDRHDVLATYHGTNDDIKAFGQLGLMLCAAAVNEETICSIFDEFKQLMLGCVEATREKPIKATTVQHTLKHLLKKL